MSLHDELKRLAEGASEGPWRVEELDQGCQIWARQYVGETRDYRGSDAALIVALRNNLPAILSALKERDALREAVRREMRAAELSAAIMRDPNRTGGWGGSENTANAFDRIANRLRQALEATNEQ